MSVKWPCIDSSSELLQEHLRALGSPLEVQDVFGLDEQLLCFISGTVRALVLLFPVSEQTKQAKRALPPSARPSTSIFFAEQTVKNACGTVALLHAVGNTPEGCFGAAKAYLDACKPLSPRERGELLGKSEELAQLHANFAQRAVGEDSEDVDLHFVCFVPAKDAEGTLRVCQLDGRSEGVVRLTSETTRESFLHDAARVVQREFVAYADGDLRFSLVALTV